MNELYCLTQDIRAEGSRVGPWTVEQLPVHGGNHLIAEETQVFLH